MKSLPRFGFAGNTFENHTARLPGALATFDKVACWLGLSVFTLFFSIRAIVTFYDFICSINVNAWHSSKQKFISFVCVRFSVANTGDEFQWIRFDLYSFRSLSQTQNRVWQSRILLFWLTRNNLLTYFSATFRPNAIYVWIFLVEWQISLKCFKQRHDKSLQFGLKTTIIVCFDEIFKATVFPRSFFYNSPTFFSVPHKGDAKKCFY